MTKLRAGLLRSALVGLLVGLAAYALQPKRFTGQVGLFFAGVDSKAFLQVTEALKASDGERDYAGLQSSDSTNFVPMAMTILRSPAAAASALNQPDQQGWIQRDRVTRFERNLQVESPDAGIVRLQLTSSSPALAREHIERLLSYYRDFVANHALTRTKAARQETEARLKKVVESLARLEIELSKSSSLDLRKLGDAALKANPKVMSQVWLRRVDNDRKANELLRQMAKIRQNRGQPGQQPTQEWLNQWAAAKLEPPTPRLFASQPVRPQDLQKRARLERTYYEALLLHRSLLLQQSLLLTCESLETPTYELIEPLSIRSERPNFWWFVMAGTLVMPLASRLWSVLGTSTRRA